MLISKNKNQIDIKELLMRKENKKSSKQNIKDKEEEKNKITKKLSMEKTVEDTIANINKLLNNEVNKLFLINIYLFFSSWTQIFLNLYIKK